MWIIQVSPKSNHESPYKREAEGDLTHMEKAVWKQSRKRFEDAGLKDWSPRDATIQELLPATGSWKSKKQIPAQEPSKRACSRWHIDFNPGIPI